MGKVLVAIAEGDGIGPEILSATLHVLKEASAPLEFHPVEMGEKVYLRGIMTGIDPKTWETLRKTRAFLKAPMTTPRGGGYKSVNVTIRTALGLYANIRPCLSYDPILPTQHPEMDVVIVRENEEDLYTGVEYQQTPNVATVLKTISREGSEKIIRYAFEYAKQNGRKKVSCFVKDNILKRTDGLFHAVFQEIAAEYPDLLNDNWIVDIGSAKLAHQPEIFDVIVMPNLYGDILSDVAAEIAGSIGLVGTANIGEKGAMFEAIHGSAPTLKGKNQANPSALLLAAVQMLVYLDLPDLASSIHNAWKVTLESGIHTRDIYNDRTSSACVGTQEFAEHVAKNLGKKPKILKSSSYQKKTPIHYTPPTSHVVDRRLVGVDVFVYHKGILAQMFPKISHINIGTLSLKAIFNRGTQVWPEEHLDTFCIEEWRCRFLSDGNRIVSQGNLFQVLEAFDHVHMDVIRMEFLYIMNGKSCF